MGGGGRGYATASGVAGELGGRPATLLTAREARAACLRGGFQTNATALSAH